MLGYIIIPFIHNHIDASIAKIIWYPSNLFVLVVIFSDFKREISKDNPMINVVSNIGVFWILPFLPSVFVFHYYNIDFIWKWVIFAYAFIVTPCSFFTLLSSQLKQDAYSKEEKAKMSLNMFKYIALFLLIDLLYMAIFNDFIIFIFIFGILVVILSSFNLVDAFLHGFSNLSFFMVLEFLLGMGLSGYLIYIIPSEKLQSIVLTIFAALVGGAFTLLSVAWTIKKTDADRQNDLSRIELERKEEERKKFVPWVNYYIVDEKFYNNNISVVNTRFGYNFKYRFNDFLLSNTDFSNFILKAVIIDENICAIEPSWYIKKEATIRISFVDYVFTNKKIEDICILVEDLLGNEYKVHIDFKSKELEEFIEINGVGCSKAEYQVKE